MAPFFFFDFTLDKSAMPPVEDIPETQPLPKRSHTEQKNCCPYPIPKIEQIVKDIEKAAYAVNTSKFVSDLFECGAIAISNAVTLHRKTNGKSGICKLSEDIDQLNREALWIFSVRFLLCSPPLSTITAGLTTILGKSL